MEKTKGFFGKLFSKDKRQEKNKSCCCNFKVEEIKEDENKEDDKQESNTKEDNSCCH